MREKKIESVPNNIDFSSINHRLFYVSISGRTALKNLLLLLVNYLSLCPSQSSSNNCFLLQITNKLFSQFLEYLVRMKNHFVNQSENKRRFSWSDSVSQTVSQLFSQSLRECMCVLVWENLCLVATQSLGRWHISKSRGRRKAEIYHVGRSMICINSRLDI